MPNAISIEYYNLQKGNANGVATLDSNGKIPCTQINNSCINTIIDSQKGQANGVASLDGTGHVPQSQLPSSLIHNFKGTFPTVSALQTAFPTGTTGDYAFITGVGFYYWNNALNTPSWVNQFITRTNFVALTTTQQIQIPYIIIP